MTERHKKALDEISFFNCKIYFYVDYQIISLLKRSISFGSTQDIHKEVRNDGRNMAKHKKVVQPKMLWYIPWFIIWFRRAALPFGCLDEPSGLAELKKRVALGYSNTSSLLRYFKKSSLFKFMEHFVTLFQSFLVYLDNFEAVVRIVAALLAKGFSLYNFDVSFKTQTHSWCFFCFYIICQLLWNQCITTRQRAVRYPFVN